MSFAYPVMLDIAGRRCLVVGGGPVAERKMDGLLTADARVTVVSPSLTPALLTLAAEARLHWRPREYVAGDADQPHPVNPAGRVLISDECQISAIW